MDDRVCQECNEVFNDAEGVRRHVKKHGITFQEYALKWVYDSVVPKCRCGCGAETLWNVALKRYAEFVRGHHAWGRKKSDEEKRKIGDKNRENMQRYMHDHPEIAKQRSQAMRAGITPEVEVRRIEASRQAYAKMTDVEKQGFRDRIQKRWDDGEMDVVHEKASQTWKQRYDAGEYDFTERNQKLSEAITKRYLEGGFQWCHGTHVSAKTGRTAYYRSSWERMLMEQLDADTDVVDWESEFTSIPYEFEGVTHRYVPDFHVVRSASHQFIEVKPQSLRAIPKNEAKRRVALEFCRERGWQYLEWEPA